MKSNQKSKLSLLPQQFFVFFRFFLSFGQFSMNFRGWLAAQLLMTCQVSPS